MTRSPILSDYAKEIYFNILSAFSPSCQSLSLTDQVEEYESLNNCSLNREQQEFLLSSVKRKLRDHIQSRENKGSQAKFQFSKADDNFLVGISYANQDYEVFPRIYDHLISMDDIAFEKMSAKYIQMHFCDFAFVTRRSGDGGIDFVGNGTFKKLLNISNQPVDLKTNNLSFRMIGQSKRYNPRIAIGPKEIREFLGSVRILQESINPNKENAWLGQQEVLKQIKLAEPFIYVFLTTSYYSEDAIDLSSKLGIYAYDVDDIIFDLIEHKIGMKSNKFNSALFADWYMS